MEVQGVGAHCVIQRDNPEEKTEGGILLPDSAKRKVRVGTIVSVGDEADKFGLSPGDRVLFDSYQGQDHEVERGKKYLFIEMKHVFAKLKDTVKVAPKDETHTELCAG